MTSQHSDCPGYSHNEHTADVLIEARGRTLEEAFEKLYDDDIEAELDALKSIRKEDTNIMENSRK